GGAWWGAGGGGGGVGRGGGGGCGRGTGGGLGTGLRCPVFFPGFWAMLDHEPGGATSLEVVRTFGEPVEIARIARPGAPPVDVDAVRLVRGARLALPV